MMRFDQKVNHRMRVMLLAVGILFGAIFLYKGFQILMMKWFIGHRSQTISISAMKVGYSRWQPQIKATGTLRAVQGVDVTTEVAGMVKAIHFNSGAMVKKDTILVELNSDSDIAALHSLEANEELAKITYERDKLQYHVEAISKQNLDTDAANLKSLRAQVAQQAALVAKKSIKAPFEGRLGISLIDLGQFVNPGDKIVTLQTLNPILVDFYVPQQSLAQLQVGQVVSVASDAYPGEVYTGKITTINPAVDANTRNVEVEATLDNPRLEITPGMFVSITITTGIAKSRLTLPQTAISFNPYGELVYIIKEKGHAKKRKNAVLIANQSFVETGETRGDQVEILKGLKEGDIVVTSGQLKLKNGSQVAINNSIVPPNNPSPITPNEH